MATSFPTDDTAIRMSNDLAFITKFLRQAMTGLLDLSEILDGEDEVFARVDYILTESRARAEKANRRVMLHLSHGAKPETFGMCLCSNLSDDEVDKLTK